MVRMREARAWRSGRGRPVMESWEEWVARKWVAARVSRGGMVVCFGGGRLGERGVVEVEVRFWRRVARTWGC